MKYKFYVGDYVELKDGRYGYITEIHRFTFRFHLIGLDPKLVVMQYPLYDSYSLYGNNFNRIGQYDFTKKDEGKIEKIDVKKAGSVFTRYETAIIDTISNKINELVEDVNQLEEEINEM